MEVLIITVFTRVTGPDTAVFPRPMNLPSTVTAPTAVSTGVPAAAAVGPGLARWIIKGIFQSVTGASVPAIITAGDALLKDIWKERRLELAMEGIRYFDLIRTGRTDLLPNKENYISHDGLLPLPIGDVNTFGLPQNKGY